MTGLHDPICAQISASGTAAVTLLRVSGKGAIGIVAQFFQPRARLLKAKSHTIVFGTFHDTQGSPLDQVLCSVFRAPHSYTGEDCVEISCHGNPRLASRILASLLTEARNAEPGEFTLRALLNGKLDLTQAEAVHDLITAPGGKAGTAALMQVQGLLSKHLRALLDEISSLRLRCELAIDFADQDLPQADPAAMAAKLSELRQKTQELYEAGQTGRLIRDGVRICLAGPPNSGKSSLFNAFLRYNRAIVTPHPGTTRDYLEEAVSYQGYTLVLTDTAGLRESPDIIERQGIESSRELMKQADIILMLRPADGELTETGELLPAELASKTLWLASKYDLVAPKMPTADQVRFSGTSEQSAIPASVEWDEGLNLLYPAILERCALPQVDLERPLITNARHIAALERCLGALEKAEQAMHEAAGYEFVAFDLIAAAKALEEILGIVADPDLLGTIFANFCVGK